MPIHLLSLSGAIVSLALAAYYMIFAGRRIHADRYLGILLMLAGLTFLFNYFQQSGIFLQLPGLIFLDMGIPFLLGPVIWFYVMSLTRGKNHKYNQAIHLVPALVIYVVFLDIIFLPPEDKLELLNAPAGDTGLRFKAHTILQLLPVPVYLVFSYLSLVKYRVRLKRSHSSLVKKTHRWLSVMLMVFLVFWLVISAGIILDNFFNENFNGEMIFTLGMMSFIVFIGIYGYLRNRNVDNLIADAISSHDRDEKVANKKYQAVVEQFTSEQKPYLEPELTLHGMATRLGVPPHTLSHILNSEYEMNFFDYINTLRIREFKEMISRGEHRKYSILALAYECGFNSKTAFYRFFKNREGISPGEYIKSREKSSVLQA